MGIAANPNDLKSKLMALASWIFGYRPLPSKPLEEEEGKEKKGEIEKNEKIKKEPKQVF